MRAQILSIGSELILGHLTDTNATFLAQALATLGIQLTIVTQVGDDLELLASVLQRATSEAELVICTGGIGPTADDLTREAIALTVGETPTVDQTLLEEILAFFRARGLDMPERNAKQAWLIPSADALANPVGTAPGWFVRHQGTMIVAMPGVPREMTRMWQEQVVPRLRPSLDARALRTLTLRTIGIGESAAESLLVDLVALDNPVVATYAKDDGVHVRVTAVGEDDAEASALLDRTAADVRARLGTHVYGEDGISLASALIAMIRDRGAKIAVADAGGGGRFAAMLAADPGAADVVHGASVVFAGQEPAARLAESARASGAGIGVGIHVVVEPRNASTYEGTIDVAVVGAIEAAERMPMRSGYEDVQRRSGLFAADVLRRALLRGV